MEKVLYMVYGKRFDMTEKSKQIIFLIINCVVAVCNIISNFRGGLSVWDALAFADLVVGIVVAVVAVIVFNSCLTIKANMKGHGEYDYEMSVPLS